MGNRIRKAEMTINDFRVMLMLIRDKTPFKVGYQLLRNNKLNNLIDSLGGIDEAVDYFDKVANAEAPEWTNENLD